MARPVRYDKGWRINTMHKGRGVKKRFPESEYGSDAEAYRAACEFLEDLKATSPDDETYSPTIPKDVNLKRSVLDYLR